MKLKPKGHTAVDRTFNLSGSGIDEIWNKFQVLVIQQVLAAY